MKIQHEFEFREIIDDEIEQMFVRENDYDDYLESDPVLLLDKDDKTFRIGYFQQYSDPFDDTREPVTLKSNCSEGWTLDKEDYLWALLPKIN